MFIRTSKHWYIFGHVLVPCNTSDAPPPHRDELQNRFSPKTCYYRADKTTTAAGGRHRQGRSIDASLSAFVVVVVVVVVALSSVLSRRKLL